ncbi:hypothetical protein [Nitratireductor thuwali]|uniref:luciferase domain-containing protein n=1 Tax=Nitratireductor thuwali TaxID=2267699 RepID=UPI0030CE6839
MLTIPPREGPRPKTTPCAPHTQISQNPDARFHRAFKDRAFDFPFVTRQPSMISVPGAEALCLEHGHGRGCRKAFMIGNEFAHVHPPQDSSLHMMLPEEAVPQIVDLGGAASDGGGRHDPVNRSYGLRPPKRGGDRNGSRTPAPVL